MGGAWNSCETCADDRSRNVFRDRPHLGDVMLADEHQRRTTDLTQAFGDRGVKNLLLSGSGLPRTFLHLVRAEDHRPDAIPDLRIDVLRLPLRAVEPQTQGRIRRRRVVVAFEGRLLLRPAGTCLLRPLPTGQARRDHDEPLDEIRPIHGELERNAAPERASDDRRRPVERRVGVAHVRERLGLKQTVAEAAKIRRDDAISSPIQGVDLRAPHTTVGDPRVEEQHGLHVRPPCIDEANHVGLFSDRMGEPPAVPYPPDPDEDAELVVELGDLVDAVALDREWANLRARGLAALRVEVRGCRLTGTELAEATLTDVTFSDCRLDLVGLRMARLQRVVFRDCRMAECDLYDATLADVLFERCELREATFSGARLERVELRGCDLTGLRGIEALRGARMPWNDVLENAPLFAVALGVEIVD